MDKTYNKYFPFYEDSLYSASRMASFPVSDIFVPAGSIDYEILESWNAGKRGDYFRSLFNSLPSFIRFTKIDPLGLYLAHLSRPQFNAFYYAFNFQGQQLVENGQGRLTKLSIKDNRVYADGLVTVYDYSTIADEIEPVFVEDSSEMVKSVSYVSVGLEIKEILNYSYIEKAIQGLRYDESARFSNGDLIPDPYREIEQIEEGSVIEREDENSQPDYEPSIQMNDTSDAIDISKILNETAESRESPITESDIEKTLIQILSAEQRGIKSVPCLAGLSGVTKSALIKKVANKLSLKFVDFRAAFLHRLDMEGMFYLTDKDGNDLGPGAEQEREKFTRQAYLGDFVKVSDQYMDYARRMKEKLQAIQNNVNGEYDAELELLSESEIADGDIALLDKMIEKFEMEEKPSLLFFEEIVRAQEKIMNLFTILLDSKRFGELTFFRSKIAAAANTPHGMSNIEDGIDLFVSQNTEDPAIFNRLQIIPVTPISVFPSWMSWIRDQGWHQLIIEFLENDPDRAYNLSYLDNPDIDVEVKRQATYPTYRAWENVNLLLKQYEKNEFIVEASLVGLLGEGNEVTKDFLSHLRLNAVFFSEKTPTGNVVADDIALAMIECNIEAGVPVGLFGPSGMGKCVFGESKIFIDGEVREIKEIVKGEGFQDYEGLIKRGVGYDMVSATFKELKAETRVVKFENGLELGGTLEHPLKVLKGKLDWKEIRVIKPGDYIAISNEIIEPNLWRRDIDFWIKGFILGDGSIRDELRTSFIFHKDNEKRIKELIEGYYKFKMDDRALKKEDNFKGRQVKDGFYRRYVKDNVIEYCCYKFPVKLTKSGFYERMTSDQFYSKLAGYIDSDGYVSKNGYLEFGCSDEVLIKELQEVLMIFGYLSRNFTKFNTKEEKEYYYCRLNRRDAVEVARRVKKFSFLKREQLGRLEIETVSQDNETIPMFDYLENIRMLYSSARKKSGYKGRFFNKKVCPSWFRNFKDRRTFSVNRIKEFSLMFGVELDEELKELISYRYLKVGQIKEDKADVYDVTVPVSEEFLCNGVVSHNSARVEDFSLSKGYDPLVIQLSQKSPSDLMGAPAVVDISAYMIGELSVEIRDKELAKGLFTQLSREALDEVEGLPSKITVRAPSYELKKRLEKTRDLRKAGIDTKLVLFFDEVNRIAPGAEAVQSAVFEAISDHRFLGIDFDPDELSVVVAANVDYEEMIDDEVSNADEIDEILQEKYGEKPAYVGTKPIDSALKLRISSLDKKKIDLSDVVQARKYMTSEFNSNHKIVKRFFEEATNDEILFMMRSAEYKNAFRNVPALRSFSSLSHVINENPRMWSGGWFFPTEVELFNFKLDLSNTITSDGILAREIFDKIIDILDVDSTKKNWVCIGYPDNLPISIPTVDSPKEVIDAIDELLKNRGNLTATISKFAELVIGTVIDMEEIVRKQKKMVAEVYLGDGDVGSERNILGAFIDTANLVVSGRDFIDFEAIVDRQIAGTWVTQELAKTLIFAELYENSFTPCFKFLFGADRIEEVVHVLAETYLKIEPTLGETFSRTFANEFKEQLIANDVELAKFNNEIIDAIQSGPVGSLGVAFKAFVDKK